jgi:hypothetical protein
MKGTTKIMIGGTKKALNDWKLKEKRLEEISNFVGE